MSKIVDRIERELGLPGLSATLADKLKPSDLQSLWLEVTRLRAAGRTPPEVLAEYTDNRFVRPSPVRPQDLGAWDRVLHAQLPSEVELLELSPVCPLGTNSVVAGVAQNWAVATERNTEVISDCTNVLALEATIRRRQAREDSAVVAAVHLGASHRLLRAQAFKGKGQMPHFRLFGLCSAGRGAGFEQMALALHLSVLLGALYQYLGFGIVPRLALSDFGDPATPAEQMHEWLAGLQGQFPGLVCQLAPERKSGRGYYRGWCFHLFATMPAGEEMFLADGGAVDWSRRLLSDQKERMVISGIGSERLCTAFVAADDKGRSAC